MNIFHQTYCHIKETKFSVLTLLIIYLVLFLFIETSYLEINIRTYTLLISENMFICLKSNRIISTFYELVLKTKNVSTVTA